MVKEIVFKKGESPLDGTLPQYVIVDFLEYCGPEWIKNQLPIPPVELQCQSHCCSVKFVPLSLAYEKTGHTFQGQSAGLGHAIPCIIIQPRSSKMEKIALDYYTCLFHVALLLDHRIAGQDHQFYS